MGRTRAVAAIVVVGVLVTAIVIFSRGPSVSSSEQRIEVAAGPGAAGVIALDATLYGPDGVDADSPAPAVVLTHGFAGTKASVASDARALAGRGYVVLAYSARGFGGSGGEIALAAPDFEAADVSGLIDWLAARDEVLRDGDDDPRVGVAGASYGGGISLLAAAADPRIDAVAALSAWSSLVDALSPNAAASSQEPGVVPGVFKEQWASLLFTSASISLPAAGGAPAGAATAAPSAPEVSEAGSSQTVVPTVVPTDVATDGPTSGPSPSAAATPATACGRFQPGICAVYAAAATTGVLDEAGADLIARSDVPGERITAPTLLVQGMSDTLFDLGQSTANATTIAAAGTPVSLRWVLGGHDAPSSSGAVDDNVGDWFDRWLREDTGIEPAPVFAWSEQASGRVQRSDTLPDASPDAPRIDLALSADGVLADVDPVAGEVSFATPPGGVPAALSSLPVLGRFGAALPATDIPGQNVSFDTAPLDADLTIVGRPRLTVRMDGSSATATGFVKVLDVAQDGQATLVGQAVAPFRVGGLPTEVTVDLPVIADRFIAGHRVRIVVASTDQAYAVGREAATVTLDAGPDAVLTLPTGSVEVAGSPLGTVIVGVLAAVAGGALLLRRRGRPGSTPAERASITATDRAPAAVEIEGLRKEYDNGFVAVDDLSFTVGRGQVFGLLGPNGAGKTSTMRMLLGLSHPTAGSARILGETMRPGHPVLARVGALVEGPGFAPYLSGLDNLCSYWGAGGGDLADAGLEAALEVAALGEAVHRPVRTYSHGMRQRLAIAQALLGNPELLVLDEPTDGLDPGQIRGMRALLAEVATGGRTVLVSSHLLAEVEQVCSHVAVMNRGRLVTTGTVSDLIGVTSSVQIDTDDPDASQRVIAGLIGAARVQRQAEGVIVDLDGEGSPDLVAALVAAGVRVRTVVPRRGLEDAFLDLLGGGEA